MEHNLLEFHPGKSPLKTFAKGWSIQKQNLEGGKTNLPTITFKADKSDFLSPPVEPGNYSSRVSIAARGDTGPETLTKPVGGEAKTSFTPRIALSVDALLKKRASKNSPLCRSLMLL